MDAWCLRPDRAFLVEGLAGVVRQLRAWNCHSIHRLRTQACAQTWCHHKQVCRQTCRLGRVHLSKTQSTLAAMSAVPHVVRETNRSAAVQAGDPANVPMRG